MKIPHITHISGEPFGKPYNGKVKSAPKKWEDAIVKATKDWPIVVGACQIRVTFMLPQSKFTDPKFLGPDLDNLMKRFLDALKRSIFKPPSDDSFVVSMEVSKTRVEDLKDSGAHLEVIPLQSISTPKAHLEVDSTEAAEPQEKVLAKKKSTKKKAAKKTVIKKEPQEPKYPFGFDPYVVDLKHGGTFGSDRYNQT